MNAYRNGITNRGASAPDIRAMLAASYEDEQEPSSAMLARAMIFAQDADRKLAEARSVKAEAERFRAEMQKTTVDQTKVLVKQLREAAEVDQQSAQELREEAESVWESARTDLERATSLREEFVQLRIAAQVDAEEYRQGVLAEAEREAINIKDKARNEVNAELAERQLRIDEEIRNAVAAIEKMQSAAQAELEAPQLYTEALRFRAASPNMEDERETTPPPVEGPKRRNAARRPRQ
jgi:hypothetical protein